MKRHKIIALVAAAVSVFAAGVMPAAQDRFTLTSANGIAFSEFRGYDTWQLIATSQPDAANGCGTSRIGCMKAILGNPVMIEAYRDGIPANGQPVPDGAAIAKIEWLQERNSASPYGITVPGPQTEVSFMVKDSKRFPETNGWGYATFQGEAATGRFKRSTDDQAVMKTSCHQCHTRGAKARDFVYTHYATR